MPENVRWLLTDDTMDVLAMRLIVRRLVDDVAVGFSRDPDVYRAGMRRDLTDYVEALDMGVKGDTDLTTEDARTRLLEVVASMLG